MKKTHPFSFTPFGRRMTNRWKMNPGVAKKKAYINPKLDVWWSVYTTWKVDGATPSVLGYHSPLRIATFWEWLTIYLHYGVSTVYQTWTFPNIIPKGANFAPEKKTPKNTTPWASNSTLKGRGTSPSFFLPICSLYPSLSLSQYPYTYIDR